MSRKQQPRRPRISTRNVEYPISILGRRERQEIDDLYDQLVAAHEELRSTQHENERLQRENKLLKEENELYIKLVDALIKLLERRNRHVGYEYTWGTSRPRFDHINFAHDWDDALKTGFISELSRPAVFPYPKPAEYVKVAQVRATTQRRPYLPVRMPKNIKEWPEEVARNTFRAIDNVLTFGRNLAQRTVEPNSPDRVTTVALVIHNSLVWVWDFGSLLLFPVRLGVNKALIASGKWEYNPHTRRLQRVGETTRQVLWRKTAPARRKAMQVITPVCVLLGRMVMGGFYRLRQLTLALAAMGIVWLILACLMGLWADAYSRQLIVEDQRPYVPLPFTPEPTTQPAPIGAEAPITAPIENTHAPLGAEIDDWKPAAPRPLSRANINDLLGQPLVVNFTTKTLRTPGGEIYIWIGSHSVIVVRNYAGCEFAETDTDPNGKYYIQSYTPVGAPTGLGFILTPEEGCALQPN